MRAIAAAVGHALVSGAVTFLCLGADAMLLRRELTPKLIEAFALFALGAATATLLGWPAATLATRRRPPSVQLAAMVLLLALGTAAFSALFFFIQTRAYYAPYYPAELTTEWLYHFAFTGAIAAYQFAVLGLRYFLPFGLIPLFAAAFLFVAEGRRRL